MERTRILAATGLMLIAALMLATVACSGPSGCSLAVPGQNGGSSGGTGNGSTPGSNACSPSTGGNTGSTTSAGSYLFIADAGGIAGEMLNPSASQITATTNWNPVSVDTNLTGTWTAVAQSKYLYVGYPSIGQIYGLAIAQDGTVSLLNSGTPFAAGYLINGYSLAAQAMITNPAGTLLFVLDPSVGQLHTYQIATDGGLSEASNSPIYMPSGFLPYNLATDGLGAYLYVSDLENGNVTGQVAAYGIGSDGSLTAVTGSPFAMKLQQMQGDSSGKYMVGTTAGVYVPDDNVYLAAIGTNGVLSTPVAYAATDSPITVAVQPNQGGTLVYTFDLNGGVEGFQIDTSKGALVTVAGSPFNIPGASGQFDPSGQFLFVAEQSIDATTNILDVYDLSATSNLTKYLATVGWSSGAWSVTDTP